MDATSLLGAMIGSDYGQDRHRAHQAESSGPGIGTIAAGALGVAAVGGLGYLAYKHFKGGQPQGPGMQHPGMQGPGGMMQGPPGMQPPGGMQGPNTYGHQASGGGAGGFMTGMIGSSSGMRQGDFSVPGYEYQTASQQPQQAPAQQSWAQPQAPQQQQPWGQSQQQSWGQPQPQTWGQQPPAQPTQPAAPQVPPVQYNQLPATPPAWTDPAATPAAAPATPAASPATPAAAATPAPSAPDAAAPTSAPPLPTPQQQKQALLLVRAMIAATYADGQIDEQERADILGRIDAAGVQAAERAAFVEELAHPKPVTMLAAEVDSQDLAEQFYIVSALAIGTERASNPEKAHLRMLPSLLNLKPEQVAALHQRANIAMP